MISRARIVSVSPPGARLLINGMPRDLPADLGPADIIGVELPASPGATIPEGSITVDVITQIEGMSST